MVVINIWILIYKLVGFILYCCIVIVMFIFLCSTFTLFCLALTQDDGLTNSDCSLNRRSIVIVIDAASTSTRTHYVEFELAKDASRFNLQPGELILKKEEKIKDFTEITSLLGEKNYPKLRKMFDELIITVENYIKLEKRCFHFIPLYFRGSSSLRALSEEEANEFTGEIENILSQYDFMKSRFMVSIMDGMDEGLYSWISTNFLNKKLDFEKKDQYHLLELAGGDFHVVSNKYKENLSGPIVNFKIIGQELQLYAESYEGLGLTTIRKNFFEKNKKSKCIHKDVTLNFDGVEYAGEEYSDSERYEFCYNKAKILVKDMKKIWKDVQNIGEINLIRGFYFAIRDSFGDSKCQNSDEDKKEINCPKRFVSTIKQLVEKAKSNCRNPTSRGNKFLKLRCIDLVYITTILTDGLGITDMEKSLLFQNKVDNFEIGWPMAIAYGSSFEKLNISGNSRITINLWCMVVTLIYGIFVF